MTLEEIGKRVYNLPLDQSIRLRKETRTARRELVDPDMADDFGNGLESDFIDMISSVREQAVIDTAIRRTRAT